MPGVHCLKCGMGKDLICERSVCPCDCHDPVAMQEAIKKERMHREALRAAMSFAKRFGYWPYPDNDPPPPRGFKY